MAKNQISTKSEGVCEKIYKAICPFTQYPKSPEPSSPKKANTELNSEEVPIHVDTSPSPFASQEKKETKKSHSSSNQKNGQQVGIVASKAEPESRVAPSNGALVPSEEGTDHRFSNYIDSAKAKIRTTSSVGGGGDSGGGGGGGKSGLRLDSFNDKINNYINRAKNKIRTTSTVGGARKSVHIK